MIYCLWHFCCNLKGPRLETSQAGMWGIPHDLVLCVMKWNKMEGKHTHTFTFLSPTLFLLLLENNLWISHTQRNLHRHTHKCSGCVSVLKHAVAQSVGFYFYPMDVSPHHPTTSCPSTPQPPWLLLHCYGRLRVMGAFPHLSRRLKHNKSTQYLCIHTHTMS